MDLQTIGKRIKTCRKQQKLTQEDLAEKIEVSPHYIYEIERGNKTMSLSILVKISTELNISTDYILFGSNSTSSIRLDSLDILIETIPARKREDLANVIKAILPYIK